MRWQFSMHSASVTGRVDDRDVCQSCTRQLVARKRDVGDGRRQRKRGVDVKHGAIGGQMGTADPRHQNREPERFGTQRLADGFPGLIEEEGDLSPQRFLLQGEVVDPDIGAGTANGQAPLRRIEGSGHGDPFQGGQCVE
ncbi:hypothetical protein GOOTI_138_00050 [Gordonia otitidis NBRC 100426]|uniref:Uncharacterized protein n=1 Tax=Gordonia otitidis (strain DSM 44809 / CCUG 52243 / JCM 12355 / NBRC 100426 / IFM 10032) TaxID=1108044 RepID=H5TNN4_GORO1|nr:hypothetical protein GOOTI_138_00050 [Gordonia otitidis NBRC 100426]